MCMRFFVLISLISAAYSCYAGVLNVNPTLLTLDKTHPIAALTVSNLDNADTMMQLKVVRWSQDHNKDIYVPTHDILVTPPLFKIKAHHVQTVRFMYMHPTQQAVQINYRAILKEVPLSVGAALGLKIALNISLPILYNHRK